MSLAELKKSQSILEAAKICDDMGREAFLKEYGFGPAREYILTINGRSYDSKAIVGVAHGIEFPQKGPLRASEFSGGENTVRKKLQELGFIVRRDSEIPLVLSENEVTFAGRYDHWQDVTGERYHFPNQYRNLITTGRPFIYYHGVRRKSGERQMAAYFGRGLIGEIWRDPTQPATAPRRNWRWFCTIEEYQAFKNPVPFKIDGQYLEQIPLNKYRNGVRQISQTCYEQILAHAGVNVGSRQQAEGTPDLPALDQVKPSLPSASQSLIVRSSWRTKTDIDAQGTDRQGSGRRSKYATTIGNRAEEIVLKHLRESLPATQLKSLRWVAGDNLGWDIEYADANGRCTRIEVKGTSGPRFPNVEFTANEWDAARKHRMSFWLYLVSDCLTRSPKIEKILDPYGNHLSGQVEATPLSWRLLWVGSDK